MQRAELAAGTDVAPSPDWSLQALEVGWPTASSAAGAEAWAPPPPRDVPPTPGPRWFGFKLQRCSPSAVRPGHLHAGRSAREGARTPLHSSRSPFRVGVGLGGSEVVAAPAGGEGSGAPPSVAKCGSRQCRVPPWHNHGGSSELGGLIHERTGRDVPRRQHPHASHPSPVERKFAAPPRPAKDHPLVASTRER